MWAVALAVQIGFHLPFDHDFLDALQPGPLLSVIDKPRLTALELITLDTGHLTQGFLTVIQKGDNLHLNFMAHRLLPMFVGAELGVNQTGL